MVEFFETWASRGTWRDEPEALEGAVVEGLPLLIEPSDECDGSWPLAFVTVRDCSAFCEEYMAVRGVGGA